MAVGTTQTIVTETVNYEEASGDEAKNCQLMLTSKECPKINIYDQLLPENESYFLTRVRQWEKSMGFVTPIRWINLIGISLFHIVVVSWTFYWLTFNLQLFRWKDIAFATLWGIVAGFGVTGGAHRYWSHRSYKAKLPLKIILGICYAAAGQNSIFNWVRDHRVHHKYSESTADPHDANRGFFFAHVGWLMMKKHPDVLKKGSKIDMSDITSDPLIQFHNRYFTILKLLFCFAIPIAIPLYFFNSTLHFAVMSQLVRYMVTLNATWSVNSFAHIWGNKPYDRHIMPTQNWGVSFMALGEGWHNYHHSFPWDYKAAELPYSTNLTTIILDVFAAMGWAYEMKTTPQSLIRTVIATRGDYRQHPLYKKTDLNLTFDRST